MKGDDVILDKSFRFGLRIIKIHLYLKQKGVDRTLSVQLLRSGTSFGANAEEAIGGSSKRDFKHKLRIACREARETSYWLRLLKENELVDAQLAESVLVDCTEIIRILTSILNSTSDE